ncbi:MAG: VCBS repeat-containing protein [Bacteroidia bacterium]|nr:VCBS repeat-containing protein [Bacteroidia bacterium]
MYLRRPLFNFLLPAMIPLVFIACKPTVFTPVFEAKTIDDKVAIGYGLAIGDVDGDGKKDILLADKKQFVWYRNGDWKRFVMVDSLTEADNVCVTARDINGDGKVEVAVGAQWNPGETNDLALSGSVHYLIRPEDPTQPWTPVELYHEVTIHRMNWVRANGQFFLTVLPLHGTGNQNGEGTPVNLLIYPVPGDLSGEWTYSTLSTGLHATHNYEAVEGKENTYLLIGGKEGIRTAVFSGGQWSMTQDWKVEGIGFGEVRQMRDSEDKNIITGISPMHGTALIVGTDTLYKDFAQGHGLASADLLGQGFDQIVAGWRNPNSEQKVGIRLFYRGQEGEWQNHLVDDNKMACEDLKVADLDDDGKPDIIAAGRATNNLIIYWNRSLAE